jgi:hypothetical protein
MVDRTLRASNGPRSELTTLYLQFEKEAEAAFGLPPNVHSYALLPTRLSDGRFGPVCRIPLGDAVYEDQWGHLPGSRYEVGCDVCQNRSA